MPHLVPANPTAQRFDAVPGLVLFHDVWDAAAHERLLRRLLRDTPWETHRLRLFGREIAAPRLSAWHGDAGADYAYSGLRLRPAPWTPELARIRTRVEALCGQRFNSALLNLYRDGNDCVGWHSDDEPELDPAAAIASVSLGAARAFCLRHRREPQRRLRLVLPGGSVLTMRAGMQSDWRHSLPRTRRAVAARVNLTFRRVRTPHAVRHGGGVVSG